MKNKILMLGFVFVLLSCFSFATCTCSMSQDPIFEGETESLVCSCSSNNEQSQAYEITWRNQLGNILQTDAGLTPATKNTPFVESFGIPFGQGITIINGTLTGINLEGGDSATVLTASNGTLILGDFEGGVGDALIGKLGSVKFTVKDNNNNTVTNAICTAFFQDFATGRPIGTKMNGARAYEGLTTIEKIPTLMEDFTENSVTKTILSCSCIPETDRTCYNSEGLNIGYAAGSVIGAFPIGTWIQNVSTVNDKSEYTLEDEYISVCADITNQNDFRIPIKIQYSFRCGGSDNSTDRVIVDSHEELRGISGNTTQNQCHLLKLYNIKTVANKENQCYSSTDVCVLNEKGNCVIDYPTTSEIFTFTSDSEEIEDNDVVTVGGTEVLNMLLEALFIFLIGAILVYLGLKSDNQAGHIWTLSGGVWWLGYAAVMIFAGTYITSIFFILVGIATMFIGVSNLNE